MQRSLYKLMGFLVLISLLFSCQKEITFDLSLPSIGRLKCSSTSLSGTYIQNQAMNTENSIFMKIGVTRRGTYHVESIGVENGIKFSSDGVFEEDGLQDIRLFATGTPQFADTFIYQIVYNEDTCEIPIYFQPDVQVQNAVMTFDGQPNTCNIDPTTDINGLFMVGLPMNASNTITIHANVLTTGIYSIETPLINGVRFSAQGEVNNTGPADIVLQASGTPIAQNNTGSNFYYPVTLGSSACAISLSFQPAIPPITIIDADCANLVVAGNYIQDEPTNRSTHYVKIPVNYTSASTAGTYNISTAEINGVIFSGTGVLDPSRNDSILLIASGTPTNGNPNPYTYSFSYPSGGGLTSSCTFNIPVTGNYITANVNGVFTTFNVNADAAISASVGTTILEISGISNALSSFPDITITLILSSGASFNSGSYNVNNNGPQPGELSCDYNQNNIIAYGAQTTSGTTQANPFTLEVDGSSTRINGRFYGTLYLNSQIGQQQILIDNGVFSLPLP